MESEVFVWMVMMLLPCTAARDIAINEQRPILIEALTYRVGHHSTSDDSTKYRSVVQIEHWRLARDSITRLRRWIESRGWWSNEAESQLRSSVRKQLLNTIQAAERLEKPCIADIFSDVHDVLSPNLFEQEKWLRETMKRYPQDYPPVVPLETCFFTINK